MKTAEEHLREINGLIEVGRRYPESELRICMLLSILAREIEVLEGAAKMACESCSIGRVHSLAMNCEALLIHDRIAELKKDAAAISECTA